MTVLSGKYGAVNGQSTTQAWTMNESNDLVRYVTSNTKAGTGQRSGVYDFSGSFEAKGGFPLESVLPGNYFTFKGFTGPADGARASDGVTFDAISAMATALEVRWNWQEAEILEYTVEFADGIGNKIVRNPAENVLDNSPANVPSVCPTKIDYGSEAAEIEWPNLVSATLRIDCNAQEYVNSSTNCNTARRRGALSATLSVVEQSEGVSLFAEGEDVRIRIYTDGVLFWLFENMTVRDFSDLRVDNMTTEIIQQTVNFDWTSNRQLDGSSGQIVLPGAAGPYFPDAYNLLTNVP